MTTLSAVAAPSTGNKARKTSPPSFFGVLRGELFKLSHQRLNWLMILAITAITLLAYVFVGNSAPIRDSLRTQPLYMLYELMGSTLAVQRVVVGIFLLVATARMVGLEYQQGTIRVVLARGVGRMQLLGAKIGAMALVGLALFAWGVLLNVVGMVVTLLAVMGNLDAFNALTGAFWTATGAYMLTVLVSMGVSILLAASITIVTRSLSFGLAGALGWFAADNIGVLVLFLIYRVTQSDFWINVTGYLLGPELNLMPSVVVPALSFTNITPSADVAAPDPAVAIGIQPLVTYDGAHALVTALVYALIFAAAAALVMWRRDVLE